MNDIIAFYLPQYHPIKENDEWYGKGFTEWTNVARAKPLFKNHYQPHIPADLGFYDLRLQEVRRQQASMALQYGISAFCYWNYWFGEGKQLMTMPLREVLNDKEIKLPFCIGWANHSWEKKQWDRSGNNELLIEQQYLGEKDYIAYFQYCLPYFKDDRYYKVGEKLFFLIYVPLDNPEISSFINIWRSLAKENGLPDFFFVGKDNDCRNIDKILGLGFNAVYDDNTINIHHKMGFIKKCSLFFERNVLKRPTVFKYKSAIRYMITENSKREDVIPVVCPNWDHSPRTGPNAFILDECDPKYFKQLLRNAFAAIAEKEDDHKILIVKSWNEWGEGNHLEPDLKYKTGYLEALKDVILENA